MPDPTIGGALRALHHHGRLREPWLPGMATRSARGNRWRAYSSGGPRLAAQGEPRGFCADFALLTSSYFSDVVEPDIDDPATVGGLLALAREAWRDPGAYACQDQRSIYKAHWLAVFPRLRIAFRGPTEGAAVGESLIRAATSPTLHLQEG